MEVGANGAVGTCAPKVVAKVLEVDIVFVINPLQRMVEIIVKEHIWNHNIAMLIAALVRM